MHLAETKGLRARVANGRKEVTYVHLMFDAHQIIFAENVASESFYPGANALYMLSPEAIADLMQVCPEFMEADSLEEIARIYGPTAREIVKRHEVTVAACEGRPEPVEEAAPAEPRWPVAA